MTGTQPLRRASPPLGLLVTQPTRFFEALRALPANPWRFVWLLLPLGVVAAVYGTLHELPVNQALRTLGLSASGLPLVGKFVASVVGLGLAWAVTWGLTVLAGGKAGRPAEVFSATFVLAGLTNVLSLLVLLIPVHLTLPTPPLTPDAPADAVRHLRTDLLRQLSGSPRGHLSRAVSFGLGLWPLAVQYLGLKVMLGDVRRARIAIVPAALLVLVAPWF